MQGNNKKLLELSETELLKLLEGVSGEELHEPLPEKNKASDPIIFFNNMGITAGLNAVPISIVYRIFSYFSNKKPNYDEFYVTCKALFKYEELRNETKIFLNKTILDLYKFIEKNKSSKSISVKKYTKTKIAPYKRFLKEYSIEPGPDFIELDFIYHLYYHFCKKNKRFIIKKKEFEQVMKLTFDLADLGFYTKWVGVDRMKFINTTKISKDDVINWRKARISYEKFLKKQTPEGSNEFTKKGQEVRNQIIEVTASFKEKEK